MSVHWLDYKTKLWVFLFVKLSNNHKIKCIISMNCSSWLKCPCVNSGKMDSKPVAGSKHYCHLKVVNMISKRVGACLNVSVLEISFGSRPLIAKE